MGHVGSPPAYENQQTQKPQQQFGEAPTPAPPQQVHQQVPQQHQPQQAPMAQQYAQQPMQQQGHTGPYPIPLGSLGDQAAWVNCPSCHAVQMTRVEYVAGTTTHLWALALCCCLCLGCIPYCVSSMKDAEHHCGQCGALLATYKRGSGTQVNAGAISGQPMPPQQVKN